MGWFARAASSGAGLLARSQVFAVRMCQAGKAGQRHGGSFTAFLTSRAKTGGPVRCVDVAAPGHGALTRAYGDFRRFGAETADGPRRANTGHSGGGGNEVVIEPASTACNPFNANTALLFGGTTGPRSRNRENCLRAGNTWWAQENRRPGIRIGGLGAPGSGRAHDIPVGH